MPLISCADCNTQFSDQAAACLQCGRPNVRSSPPPPPARRTGSVWRWIIGVPVAGFALLVAFGAVVNSTPEGAARAADRQRIATCLEMQGSASLSPSAARIAASTCERMQDQFRATHGITY